MDASAFSFKLRGVDLEEGIDEILKIIMEACDLPRDDVRTVAHKKGRGAAIYHEVTVETDAGSVKWWRSDKSQGTKDGSLMVEGEEWFFLRVLEKIVWRSREWGKYRRGKKMIEVLDDKLKKPTPRKGMWIVAVSDVEGEASRRTRIFNGQTGEQQLEAWKRRGCILMGFLDLVEAKEWQNERAGVEGWR
jgi:hypothetical protein